MILIKIYDKDFNEITSLNEKNYTQLNYQKRMKQIGDARFQVNLKDDKVNENSLKLYNRIEIIDNEKVEFTGIITKKDIELKTATIRCRELSFILKKRLLIIT